MSLIFRIEVTKKSGPRIAVVRSEKDAVGTLKNAQIGTFSARNPAERLFDKLTEDERYEMENFLSTLAFSKTHFGSEADVLDRFIIKVDPGFKEALCELWKQAKQHNLDFIPEREMLYAVLRKGRVIEQKINQLTGEHINILESLDIDLSDNKAAKPTDSESRKLFQALLELDQPIDTTCEEFKAIASRHGKQTNFKPYYFKHYAGLAGSDDTKYFPRWYYAVAIELLLQKGINPITLIAPEKVAAHWVRLRLKTLTAEEAIQQFMDKFAVLTTEATRITKAIQQMYNDD